MANIATGSNGVTSIPATRTLTSAGADFVAAGVSKGDTLHIETEDPAGDNGRYKIVSVSTTVLTVDKNWPTGSLTVLTYRVQETSQQFSSNTIDYELIKRMDHDAFWHVFTPRQWWVLNDQPTLDIYGEPSVASDLSISDGVTSIPATRTLTSATNFSTAGIRRLHNLVIADTSTPGDNGSYTVESASGTTLTITEDWPVGSLTGLSCTLRMVYHRYTPLASKIPFYLRLGEAESKLTKDGYTNERDATAELSAVVCEELGLTPKEGDRFDVDTSEGLVQQFLITALSVVPVSADFKSPHRYVCTCVKVPYWVG